MAELTKHNKKLNSSVYCMKLFFIALVLLVEACSYAEVKPSTIGTGELWVIVKLDTEFRTEHNIVMVDEITKIVEAENLGVLDGHSSGGYQLDFNYVGITNWEKAKSVIDASIRKNYPDVEFTISTKYETTYDNL